MLNFSQDYIARTPGHKPNPAHSKEYQVAEALYPDKQPERKDVTKFHKAVLLKSLGFPGFENIDTSVKLSESQEQKLIDAGVGPNPTDRTNELRNRMLLEAAFAKTEVEKEMVPTGEFSNLDGKMLFEEREKSPQTAPILHKSMGL